MITSISTYEITTYVPETRPVFKRKLERLLSYTYSVFVRLTNPLYDHDFDIYLKEVSWSISPSSSQHLSLSFKVSRQTILLQVIPDWRNVNPR